MPAEQTMEERVARALYAEDAGCRNSDVDWTEFEWSPHMKTIFFSAARAAIEATDRAELLALLRRCREAGCINPFNENAELAEDIDAALKS